MSEYRSIPWSDPPACHYTARCERVSDPFGRGYDYDEWRTGIED